MCSRLHLAIDTSGRLSVTNCDRNHQNALRRLDLKRNCPLCPTLPNAAILWLPSCKCWGGLRQKNLVFLDHVNELFDLGSGAYKDQWVHCNKPRFKPYTCIEDPRFQEYEEKWEYLEKWKEEVEAISTITTEEKMKGIPCKTREDKNALILSQQTLNNFEMICHAIPECITFLLGQGTKYIMARVFCQDPLEQHFSKQRASQGGNRNPDASQYLQNENSRFIQGKLSLKRS